jgi:aromatic ring-opening dioxygenase catalytic subunit (LigB family)
MAELCLGLATSHLAHIVNARGLGDPGQVAAFDAGYRTLAAALHDAAPDATLLVSAEHVNKFFLDNMPAFCIGVFDAFSGPVEARSRNVGYPSRRVPSHMAFARYLVERGLDEGVDWAVSESWEADHGMMVPLHKLDPDGRLAMVPVFINCAAPPLPSPRRCYAVGEWLADAIGRWDGARRVAIIATGGLSHSVGTPDQGRIDVDFDERFLDALCSGRGAPLAAMTDADISAAGSSTGEVRSWIMLAGAFAGRRAERVFYAPIRGFDTGCGQCLIR